jgi:hypothetical protein
MERAFLYIDILGFENLVKTDPIKVDKIFKVFDSLKVHSHFALQTVVFSDTILVFNKDENRPVHYYCTYLIEYSQELFYKLCSINVYFKAILNYGEFSYSQLSNIQAYYGQTLIEAYHDEKGLDGFGLYVDKKLSHDVIVFDSTNFCEKFEYVLLCQSMVSMYKHTDGKLPVDIKLFSATDSYHRIDEDLRFLREIEYLKNNHPRERVRQKHQTVYDIYRSHLPGFFKVFEKEGFLPFTLNPDYTGSINPFELLSEKELKQSNF